MRQSLLWCECYVTQTRTYEEPRPKRWGSSNRGIVGSRLSCVFAARILTAWCGHTDSDLDDAALIDYVREQGTRARAVLSLCDGAFVLAQAGLLDGLDGSWMYFVHSLAAELGAETVATVDYGGPVVAAAGRDNVFATQFHPEKSARPGLALLGAFVDACRSSAGADGVARPAPGVEAATPG